MSFPRPDGDFLCDGTVTNGLAPAATPAASFNPGGRLNTANGAAGAAAKGAAGAGAQLRILGGGPGAILAADFFRLTFPRSTA